MKAIIFYWAFENFEPITGYKDRQEIPYEDVFKIAEEIFYKGLNVMVYQNRDQNYVTLFVDDRRFTQR